MSAAIGWVIFGATVVGVPVGCVVMGILTAGTMHDAHSAGYRRGRQAAFEEMARNRARLTTAKPKTDGERILDDIAEAVELARSAEMGGRR